MYWVTCVERGEVDKMLRFIRMGIDVNERLPNGDTPLHVCVRCGHVSAAQVLLLTGARKETKNNLGYSPIQTAARYNGSRDLLLMLLRSNCNAFRKDRRGRSALDYARAYGKYDIVHAWHVSSKWRSWARKRIHERARQFVYLIWKRYKISCEVCSILVFLD